MTEPETATDRPLLGNPANPDAVAVDPDAVKPPFPGLAESPDSPMHEVAEEFANATAPTSPPPAPSRPAAPDLHVEARGRAKKNNLSRRQQRRLEDWLQEAWPTIARTGATQRTVAARAGAALGFTVTRGNLIAAMHAIGRTWPVSPRAAYVGHATRRDLATIARHLAALLHTLGRAVPADVAAIARGDDPAPKAVEPADPVQTTAPAP